jgi:hypothetical protein
MATAGFNASGSVGVCLGEQGPGGLNLASGIGTVHNNRLAMLAITSNLPAMSAYPFEGKLMEADHKRRRGAGTAAGLVPRGALLIGSRRSGF